MAQERGTWPLCREWSSLTAHKHLKERIRARTCSQDEAPSPPAATSSTPTPAGLLPAPRRGHRTPHAIAGVLANRGLAPRTGQPLSEAMVLGAGGGLGAGYILWEFKAHDSRSLVLGFHQLIGSTRTAGR